MSWADEDPGARALAETWAPVFHQDVADGAFNDAGLRRWDLLTTVDFDGNFDPHDNVENTDARVLHPAVYWDLVLTETHAYLLYAMFHPVDWSGAGSVDHENDMEHVWLVLERRPEDAGALPTDPSSLVLLATQAHGETLAWSARPPQGGFAVLPGVDLDGTHPRVFIEAHGHGPASCTHPGGLPFTEAIDCTPGPSDDHVIYRVAPGADPGDLAEPDVSEARPVEATYALVSSHAALWPHRSATTTLWDEPFDAILARNGDAAEWNDVPVADVSLGADFRGDEGGGGGVPPWGYLVDDDFLGGRPWGSRGEWLLDPPHLFATLFRDEPCLGTDGFWNVLSSPTLGDLALDPDDVPWSGEDRGRRCEGIDPTFDDAGDSYVTDAGTDVVDGCGCATSSVGHGPIWLLFVPLWVRRRGTLRDLDLRGQDPTLNSFRQPMNAITGNWRSNVTRS